jgi:uncharacterized protein (TIGR02001 family)
MKLLYKLALSSAVFVATLPPVQAETSIPVKFSGNVALTTDYVFRGITLSDENFAIQGEFDATHSSGAYIGTWASNTTFLEKNTIAPGDRANIEIDVYVGYAGEINGLGYDVFATRFIYPGTGDNHRDLDYHEFSLALSYSLPIGTQFGVEYDYAPLWGDTGSKADNYLFTVSHPLPMGFSAGASIGRQDFREAKGGTDYTYYGVQVAYSINDFTLALDFSDTNLKDANGNEIDGSEDRFFFTLSKEF